MEGDENEWQECKLGEEITNNIREPSIVKGGLSQ